MKTETFHLELITPCFCGGAEPEKEAEIRAPSIRGQLRWWFRTLGGFKSLQGGTGVSPVDQNQGGTGVSPVDQNHSRDGCATLSLREQENYIFGSTAGGEGRAGKLIVRVSGIKPSTDVVDDEKMDARPGSDKGYLLFPLRPDKKGKPNERRRDRAVFNKAMRTDHDTPSFCLHVLWRGEGKLWEDIQALVAIFGHLGSLGFRSRRAMGALAFKFKDETPNLSDALARFAKPSACQVCALDANGPDDAIRKLADWLMSWRAHGRSGQNQREQQSPGFRFAFSDHEVALGKKNAPAFRASLGMPLLTKYGNWTTESPDPDTPRGAKGRFASPVLLRPHRDAEGKWHALVIFADAHKWPKDRKVYLNGQGRDVSLDLYEAMKDDKRLRRFP